MSCPHAVPHNLVGNARMRKLFETISNVKGAVAVEYGLLAGLIAVALIGALVATGGSTEAMWDFVAQQYKSVTGG